MVVSVRLIYGIILIEFIYRKDAIILVDFNELTRTPTKDKTAQGKNER